MPRHGLFTIGVVGRGAPGLASVSVPFQPLYDPPVDHLAREGYALAGFALTGDQREHLLSSLPAVAGAHRGGVRNLIRHPAVVELLSHGGLGSLVGCDLVAVKATLFDKTPAANWRVQWHQDRAIAVRERLDVAGYGPWSTKEGALHVDAPREVLSQMLAVRIHLDASDADNGPLRVIPGTHILGKLTAEEIARVAAEQPMTELHVPQGELLFMRPLLVHSSSTARSGGHRRVLHIELAPAEAISPLKWHDAISLNRAL